MKHFVCSILILVFLATGLLAADEQKPEDQSNTSPEDREIIEMLDILELMDIVEKMELLQDLTRIVEDKGDENKK